jgi:hypothetical protein
VQVVLPIYIDSIFFPLLCDEHFLTEVYSVNSENDDSGVVFCEMQSREQEPGCCCCCFLVIEKYITEDIADLVLSKLVYPGKNGYNVNV